MMKIVDKYSPAYRQTISVKAAEPSEHHELQAPKLGDYEKGSKLDTKLNLYDRLKNQRLQKLINDLTKILP